MAADANPGRTPDEIAADAERLHALAADLADAVDAVTPAWIERLVRDRVAAWRGDVPPEAAARAESAGRAALEQLSPRMRDLLATDIDAQRTNPLALLRSATRHASAALDDLGVPPVQRDEFSERSFPDDHHGLVPATWQDVDPALHGPGLAWSAAKAFVFKARRRDEGRG